MGQLGNTPDVFTPWPNIEGYRGWNYTIGGYGREIIDGLIRALPAGSVMLEIGCFLCASSRRWLSLRDDLQLVGVDPWDDNLIEQCARYVGRPALTRAYPDPAVQQQFIDDIRRQGPFATALANMAFAEDRFHALRGYAPSALHTLADAGFEPDLIYIDGAKQAIDLDVSHSLWPNAIICGDDWHWSRTKDYPIRQIVRDFARKHGFYIIADHATWALSREPVEGSITPDDVVLVRERYKRKAGEAMRNNQSTP